MVTPVVLISACGSLLISTSNRLGRAVERSRKLAGELKAFVLMEEKDRESDEQLSLLVDLLNQAVRRSQLLERALNALYLCVGIFVLTSAAIGLVALGGQRFTSLPLLVGGVGVMMLFYASMLLIAEARLARSSVDLELRSVIRSVEEWKSGSFRKRG